MGESANKRAGIVAVGGVECQRDEGVCRPGSTVGDPDIDESMSAHGFWRPQALVAKFYVRLFERDPVLRRLFAKTDMTAP